MASTRHRAPAARTIHQHLKERGSISSIEAHAVYRCRSISSRVCELKRAGVHIETRLLRDPTGQRYARYIYISG